MESPGDDSDLIPLAPLPPALDRAAPALPEHPARHATHQFAGTEFTSRLADGPVQTDEIEPLPSENHDRRLRKRRAGGRQGLDAVLVQTYRNIQRPIRSCALIAGAGSLLASLPAWPAFVDGPAPVWAQMEVLFAGVGIIYAMWLYGVPHAIGLSAGQMLFAGETLVHAGMLAAFVWTSEREVLPLEVTSARSTAMLVAALGVIVPGSISLLCGEIAYLVLSPRAAVEVPIAGLKPDAEVVSTDLPTLRASAERPRYRPIRPVDD